MSLARAAVDQCLCLHGNGADDLEFLGKAADMGHQGLEDWSVLCLT